MEPKPPITRLRKFALSNIMLAVYFVSSAIGAAIAITIGQYAAGSAGSAFMEATLRYGPYYDLPIAIIGFFVIIAYERPIRLCLTLLEQRAPVSEELLHKARRRLLNEPYFLMALALVTWIGAAVFLSIIFYKFSTRTDIVNILAYYSILTGVISVVATFFLLQFCLQRWLIPVLFPDGKLSQVRGAIRITIAARLIGLIVAAGLVPFLIIGVGLMEAHQALQNGIPDSHVLENLLDTLFVELILFSLIAVGIAIVVTGNLTRPFHEIIQILHQIKKGRLNQRVRVVSNDEIGYTGDAVNEMAQGLQERDQMRQSLYLAREVQQSLLPLHPPDIANLDISGRSLYCDETGGDYFDFLRLNRSEGLDLAVIIGDVSGHGISSALLMASIRAQLHSRTTMPGTAAEVIDHLNQLVSTDTAETGQFMTLFYLEANCDTKSLTWVRAGHEPAFLYDPKVDRFDELSGRGLPLGVDSDWHYEEYQKRAQSGQILLLTTDGIYETRNRKGEMFGKDRFKDVVRQNCANSAENIRDTILSSVQEFRGDAHQEDDVTLVTLKFL